MSKYIGVLFEPTIHHNYIAFLFLTEQNMYFIENPFL